MLSEGQQIELAIEKPASGGRMIARHRGHIVLVRGAIPGERVSAWIERVDKRLAFAVTRDVLEPSPDRRAADADPLCGGTLYSHIRYERQLSIKADIIRDAFARIGRHPLDMPFDVMPSREEGYRMRARFHVHGGRAGFYREGTHQLCDAASTRQLLPQATAAVDAVISRLDRQAPGAAASIAITEDISGERRAAHVELTAGARWTAIALDRLVPDSGLAGISARGAGAGQVAAAGTPFVADPLASITGSRDQEGELRRHAESFFQGNRFLLGALVAAVVEAAADQGAVLDLYAGVGLFSVALASDPRRRVTAVEGDRTSGADLQHNARRFAPRLEVIVGNVEDYLARGSARRAPTTVVDPPRTGLSKDALDALVRYGSTRLIYVSCDPPTLARDTRRLLDGGYRLETIRAFDLFPNTPHVESVVVFGRT